MRHRRRRGFRGSRQPPGKGRDQQVEQAGADRRTRKAHRRDQDEDAGQRADGRADAVGKVQAAQQSPFLAREAADQSATHQRKSHAQQDRLRQDQQGGDEPLDHGSHRCRAGKRNQDVVAQADCMGEHRMEADAQNADHQLDDGIAAQQVPPAGTDFGNPGRTDRHAAHEQRKHQRLRIGGMAQEQAEVMRPDRLVDQTGEAGQDEDGQQ
ncbi:hypothetical protein [Pseudofulvimonas gallinarii]|uniref:hypothetical protein n=1 Tax=Pseudofulvimonas gallinarii TaxID=634155 RepID=UPI001A9F30CB|nr:hypothetical protein [Pseudofulvimonas gallinarii]